MGKPSRTAALLATVACAVSAAGAETPPRPDAPRPRLVTFSPALTRIAFEAGLGEHVVGVTNHCMLPGGERRPRLGDAFTVNAERILSVRPDAVLIQFGRGKFDGVTALAPDVSVEHFEIERVDDVAAAVERIGRLAGEPEAGLRAAGRFRRRLDRVDDRTTGLENPRVLFVIGTDRPVAAGPETFIGDMIRIAGGVNAGADIPGSTRWRRTQIDHVAAARPDVLICQHAGDPAGEGEYWLQWREDLPAAREGRVFAVDAAWTVPSLALAERTARLALTLHPALRSRSPAGTRPTGPTATQPAVSGSRADDEQWPDELAPLHAARRDTEALRLWRVRLYRWLAAAVVGAALAAAGAALQGLLRNPLAEPYILGISSGAGVGVLLGLATAGWLAATDWSWVSAPVLAFVGALATCAVVYLIAQHRGRLDPYTLILAGVIVNTFNAAVMLTIYLYVDPHRIADFAHWAMGRIPDAPGPAVLAVCAACALVGWGVLLACGAGLNLLGLGDEVAASSGVRVAALRVTTFAAVGLMTAAAVALAGPIGFVGLIVPHICRMIVGPAHRRLILSSGVLGAVMLVGAEVLCRRAGPLVNVSLIPVGIVTAVAGGPFFIFLLRRRFAAGGGR
ncbi:MAG: iron chelate uptake ABC transporter family permease subunit [Planctomycetota bacterium]